MLHELCKGSLQFPLQNLKRILVLSYRETGNLTRPISHQNHKIDYARCGE
jgi:hypothetical protein